MSDVVDQLLGAFGNKMTLLNPYRFGGGASGFLLDTYTGAEVAYSLRQLRTGQTYAIQVRRDSDSTTQDIGFDGSGDLDTAAIATFCGAGSGYISVWYDQSGNGTDATAILTSKEPRIYNSGSMDTLNSLPCAVFDGADDWMTSGGVTLSASGDVAVSVFYAGAHGSTTGSSAALMRIAAGSYSADRRVIGAFTKDSTSQCSVRIYGGNTVFTQAVGNGTQRVLSIHYPADSGSFDGFQDGASLTEDSSSTGALNLQSTSGFDFPGGTSSSPVYGTINTIVGCSYQECIFYLADKSGNRSSIESDMATYWGVTL